MSRRNKVIKNIILTSCISFLPCVALAAMDQGANAPHIPKPGQAQAVSGAEFGNSNFSRDQVDGASAGRALANLSKNGGLETRGASEAEVYRRIAPSVVLIVTKDGLGSGVVISKDGLILTNWHVTEGYSKVGVIFKPKDGESINPDKVIVADVVKYDQVADLALVRLEGRNGALPPPVQFGDINKVNVGDDVNAIGHPTGEMWTFTKGYVSQVRPAYSWKSEDGLEHSADIIQTQTPINPGNSGGPLLDTNGALLGINAFKAEGEGLNFAVGVSQIQKFLATKASRVAHAEPSKTKIGTPVGAGEDDCEPQVTFEGRSDSNDADIRQVDTTCDGTFDVMFVKPDKKTEPIYALIYSDEVETPVGVIYSTKRNGKWNVSYWDSKGKGKWDTVGYHPDGEFMPTSYGPYKGH